VAGDPRQRFVERGHRDVRRVAEPADDVEAAVDVEHARSVGIGVGAEDEPFGLDRLHGVHPCSGHGQEELSVEPLMLLP
jgi:hypothetical protein